MTRVLVVEDDENSRDYLLSLLGSRGYAVETAADGATALALAAATRPDLVFSDILMPSMDGFELVSRLRRDPALASVPVIFWTAYYHEREAVQLARSCGVSHVLIKPCEPEALLAAIDDALGDPHAAESAVLPRAFDVQHLRLVESKLWENTGELVRTTQKLEALIGVDLHLASEYEPQKLIDTFCNAARDLMTARYAVVSVRRQNSASVHNAAVSGLEASSAKLLRARLHGDSAAFATFDRTTACRLTPNGRTADEALPSYLPEAHHLLLAPIRSRSRFYGWLVLADKIGGDVFSEEDEKLVDILCATVGRIYENGSLYAEVREYASRLEAEIKAREKAQFQLSLQYEVVHALALADSVDEVVPAVLAHICRHMGFALGAIYEIDRGARRLRCVEVWCDGDRLDNSAEQRVRNDHPAQGEGLAGAAWQARRPVWASEIEAHAEPAADGNGGSVAVPLVARNEPIGVMLFLDHQTRSAVDAENDLLSALGNQIGQSIERKLQQQRIARLARVQAVLSGINSLIVRVHDREILFDEACRLAVEEGEFSMAWIGLYQSESEMLVPLKSAGFPHDSEWAAPKRIVRGSRDEVSRAIHENRAIHSNDLSADPALGGARRHLAMAAGCRSYVVLPLRLNDRVVGVFGLFACKADFFIEEELKLLTEVAGDISFALDHIAKASQLNYLALYDSLTGLPNRTLFVDRIERALAMAGPGDDSVGVAVFGVRGMHRINESYGRAAGDSLLRAIADRLRTTLDPADANSLSRLQGDVFAVFGGQLDDAPGFMLHLQSTIAAALHPNFDIDGRAISISITTGIALGHRGLKAGTLLESAEWAMRSATDTGQRYAFYDPSINARVARILDLETRLRRALNEHRFRLHYQPFVDITTGAVEGVEALLRLDDPVHGLVPPDEFIAVLEDTGLIIDVGAWVMEQALEDHAAWAQQGVTLPLVAVNVSLHQMTQAGFVERVAALLERHGASHPGRSPLALELTESVMMEDVAEISAKLAALRTMDIPIAIDDYGTGFSSLRYLAQLPVTALKIDRSFVETMASSSESMAIVSSTITLAHALGLKVVAEGVENEEQHKLLRLLRCNAVQGFLFSRPVPADQIPDLVCRFAQPG